MTRLQVGRNDESLRLQAGMGVDASKKDDESNRIVLAGRKAVASGAY